MIEFVILDGNIANDLELKKTTTGKSVLSFRLASSKRTGEGTNYFDCKAWNKTAELICQYCQKGSPLIVEGFPDTRTYQNAQGTNVKVVEFIVEKIKFVGSNRQEQPQQQESPIDNFEPISLSQELDEELPF